MSEFHKQTLAALPWPTESLVWSTQFNDLRLAASLGKTPEEQRDQVIRELKHYALFQSHTVIRDVDLINHLVLLELVASEEGTFRKALEAGAFVFAIREAAPDYSDINERAGEARAFSELYEAAIEPLKRIDSYFRSSQLPLLALPIPENKDEFYKLLRRLDKYSALGPSDKQLIAEAAERARDHSRNGPLRFSDMYRVLVNERRLPATHKIVQCCRAAHCLVVPASLGLTPSVANDDLPPAILKHLLSDGESPHVDMAPWVDLFPRKILPATVFDLFDFDKVVLLRAEGESLGYFKAVMEVQRLEGEYGSDRFRAAFVAYLEVLEEYLKAIGVVTKVELVEWQKAWAEGAISNRDLLERAICWGIPVAVSAYLIITSAPFAGLSALAAPAVGLMREWHKNKHPRPLVRLLQGTTAVPGSSTLSKPRLFKSV